MTLLAFETRSEHKVRRLLFVPNKTSDAILFHHFLEHASFHQAIEDAIQCDFVDPNVSSLEESRDLRVGKQLIAHAGKPSDDFSGRLRVPEACVMKPFKDCLVFHRSSPEFRNHYCNSVAFCRF